jgi:hypothetical protein
MREDEVLPANQRPVRTGGLMRCCLHTLADTTTPSKVGDRLSCAYESDPNNEQMVVALDGVWEWRGPKVLPERV